MNRYRQIEPSLLLAVFCEMTPEEVKRALETSHCVNVVTKIGQIDWVEEIMDILLSSKPVSGKHILLAI